ncbi:MAG: hypothetical protein ACRDM7_12705 [Thermoleophilaceae bacterium]
MSGGEPQDRIRTLLLRGDNRLKSGRPERLPRTVEAFEHAAELTRDPAVDPAVRQLVERRLRAARSLSG